MPHLIPIKYGTLTYPEGITPSLIEVAGHFDKTKIAPSGRYSLHTEYSAGARQYQSPLLDDLASLTSSNVNGVPQLWKNKTWATQFASFLERLVGDNQPPSVIEIHPPFLDYCPSLNAFCDIFEHFSEAIHRIFPAAEILIENRCGTRYTRSRFALSQGKDMVALSELIASRKLSLRLCADIPQIFTASLGRRPFNKERITESLAPLRDCTNMIRSIHLWGKKRNRKGSLQAHQGDLNTYFENAPFKEHFLTTLLGIFKDSKPRFFVPEVNGNRGDFLSIISDLDRAGFVFVPPA